MASSAGAGRGTPREYDVIVYGATGYTGVRICKELARINADRPKRAGPLKWAMAGRNLERLAAARDGTDGAIPADTPLIRADSTDDDSLDAMAKATRLIVAAAGPFRRLGEPVVRAAVQFGCDYVDVTGEPAFIEMMQAKYHEQAQETGSLIISAVGFDSIPAEMGTLHNIASFPAGAVCTSVEEFLSIKGTREVSPHFNYGTWESAVIGISSGNELRDMRRGFPDFMRARAPAYGAKLTRHTGTFFDARVNRWTVPFPGSDASIVRRSMALMHQAREEGDTTAPQPVQYAAMLVLGSSFQLALMMFFAFIFQLLATFSFGRTLLLKYPRFFSCGFFSKEGPEDKHLEAGTFDMTFIGNGYSKGTPVPDTKTKGAPRPDVTVVTRVHGPEVGYVATPIIICQAAELLLDERDTVKVKSGVSTTMAVFRGTSLIDRLHRNGVTFSVVSAPGQ